MKRIRHCHRRSGHVLGDVAGEKGEGRARAGHPARSELDPGAIRADGVLCGRSGHVRRKRAGGWLGGIYEKQGKTAEAKSNYAASLKINPNQKDVDEAMKRIS